MRLSVHKQIHAKIDKLGQQVFNEARNRASDNHHKQAAQKLAKLHPGIFLTATESEFFGTEEILWGEVEPFQQAFGRVFTTYRGLIHANDLLEKHPPPAEPEKRSLSTDEFEAEHGPPPWDFVNEILSVCELDFRMDHPLLHETGSYEPKLHKLSDSVEMRFQDLSSGERVLMSFALCIYNSQEKCQEKVFPKLLLLDEVDAPLHPSMTRSLLDTIQNVLVRGNNVAVILTTHNPSTVALAPEESIYAMNTGEPRIEKVSRNHAISLLTTGVPTLAVSFDGRRQVFV